MECGAEEFYDIAQYSGTGGTDRLIADVKAATIDGEGAAAVIVCTASNTAYAQALSFLEMGGTLVCLGVPEGKPMAIASADPGTLLEKELHIVGSSVGTRKDAVDCLNMAVRGIVKTHFMVKPMDQLEQTFRDMDRGLLQGRIVLDLLKETD